MIYDWICNDCCVLWEEDHPIGTAPKKTKCPECSELRDRNWGSVSTFAMKGDSRTTRARTKKFQEKGMDKDTAEEYYAGAIKNAKQGIKTGYQHYSRITPNIENLRKKGKIRMRSETEVRNATERAKQMTQAVYNDRNIDIIETLHRKPQ